MFLMHTVQKSTLHINQSRRDQRDQAQQTRSKILTLCLSVLTAAGCTSSKSEAQTASAHAKSSAPAVTSKSDLNSTKVSTPVINHQVNNIDGQAVSLSDYRGKVLLIVNTASRCGYTRQYKDLVKIQEIYGDQGFTVLAFPCNDFGGQEPGSAQEIKAFCDASFNINFPLFEKLHARGAEKSPLYQTLTTLPAPLGGEIRWNFTKFLVNTEGQVIKRFDPSDSPSSDQVKSAIEAALKSAT